MSKIRMFVEWYLIGGKRFWGLTNDKRKLRIGEVPESIDICHAAVLLTNLLTFIC